MLLNTHEAVSGGLETQTSHSLWTGLGVFKDTILFGGGKKIEARDYMGDLAVDGRNSLSSMYIYPCIK
jgi:hypothetical protein